MKVFSQKMMQKVGKTGVKVVKMGKKYDMLVWMRWCEALRSEKYVLWAGVAGEKVAVEVEVGGLSEVEVVFYKNITEFIK